MQHLQAIALFVAFLLAGVVISTNETAASDDLEEHIDHPFLLLAWSDNIDRRLRLSKRYCPKKSEHHDLGQCQEQYRWLTLKYQDLAEQYGKNSKRYKSYHKKHLEFKKKLEEVTPKVEPTPTN